MIMLEFSLNVRHCKSQLGWIKSFRILNLLPLRCSRRQRRSQSTAFQLFIGALISVNERWDLNLLPDQLPAR